MARYYTLDRADTLRSGAVINYETDFSSAWPLPLKGKFCQEDLESLSRDLFPNGLTSHGKRYLLKEAFLVKSDFGSEGQKVSVVYEPILELLLEVVRRAYFPEKPSRFSALFAWGTLAEAEAFRSQHGAGRGNIYVVEAGSAFRADMSWVALGGTNAAALWLAMKYWRGEASADPAWELLISPPVTVGDKVGSTVA